MTAEEFDSPGSLMERTRELLKTTAPKETDLYKVHSATGLPFYWLRKFAAGTFKNPSVNRVQYLYERLTSQPLISK